MLPSIYFLQLELVNILNQNLPIRDENDYDFGDYIIVCSLDLAWNKHAISSSLLE